MVRFWVKFWGDELSMVLERHPLATVEWQWFSILSNFWPNDPLDPMVLMVRKQELVSME